MSRGSGEGGSQSSPFPHASRVVGKFTFPKRTISHMAPYVLLKKRKIKKSQHRFPLQSNMQKISKERKLPVLVKALGSVRRGRGASGAGQFVE